MTPIEAKEHLHKKGYCSFNIADLSEELFDIVNLHKCDNVKSERENMTFLRADFSESSGEVNINSNYNTFEKANIIKDEKLLTHCFGRFPRSFLRSVAFTFHYFGFY